MSVDNAGDLAELGRNQVDAILREAGDVDLNVEGVVNAPFRNDAARREV